MSIRLPTINRLPQKNECNGCTECCTAAGVVALGKPARCRCEHQTDRGCGIYGGHPDECRRYACAWALGALGSNEKFRPDKCGLLFSLSPTERRPAIVVYVLRPELDKQKMQYLLDRIRSKHPGYPVTMIYPYGVPLGSAYECRPPYPVEMSKRNNVFVMRTDDPNTVVCEGPEEIASSA